MSTPRPRPVRPTNATIPIRCRRCALDTVRILHEPVEHADDPIGVAGDVGEHMTDRPARQHAGPGRIDRIERTSCTMRTTRKTRPQRSTSTSGTLASRSIQPHFMNAAFDGARRKRITKSVKNKAHTALSTQRTIRWTSAGTVTTSSIPNAASTNTVSTNTAI